MTQAQRENPIHSTIRVNEQVPVFSDSTPVQSRTFSDASPIITSLSKYTPQVKVESMTPLYSKPSFEEPCKPFFDNSPIQSPGSFEEANPMTSPFRSTFAQKVYDNKKSGYDSDNQSQASDITPIPVIPKLKKIRKKVDVSLLSAEEWRRRAKKAEYNKKYNKEHYDMNKAMKNLSL